MYFSEAKALAKLEERVMGFPGIEEVAVLHARRPEWAESIAGRLKAAYPGKPVYVSRLSAATGVHGGPASVAVAFTEREKGSGSRGEILFSSHFLNHPSGLYLTTSALCTSIPRKSM